MILQVAAVSVALANVPVWANTHAALTDTFSDCGAGPHNIMTLSPPHEPWLLGAGL